LLDKEEKFAEGIAPPIGKSLKDWLRDVLLFSSPGNVVVQLIAAGEPPCCGSSNRCGTRNRDVELVIERKGSQ
jgi:hypothetical protein